MATLGEILKAQLEEDSSRERFEKRLSELSKDKKYLYSQGYFQNRNADKLMDMYEALSETVATVKAKRIRFLRY